MSVFGGLEDSLVLVLICSSILLASFVEGADVMLCAVDSVSFFASPLAFCVSLIRSLRNLMDASSAILCAPWLAVELVDLQEQRDFWCTLLGRWDGWCSVQACSSNAHVDESTLGLCANISD